MKRRTLAFLLVIPILIALVSFVSVLVLNNTVAVDISDILWSYEENEMFKVDRTYELQAEAVYDESLVLADGNDLFWYITLDEDNANAASIRESNGIYYLSVNKRGEGVITCSNERGTKSKSFNAVFYDNGAITINRAASASQENVDSTIYYGEYDPSYSSLSMDGLSKTATTIQLNVNAVMDEDSDPTVEVVSTSDNISYSPTSNVITVTGSGNAWLTLGIEASDVVSTFSFNIVDEGVNCYSYDDLLMCTNYSSKGEVVVMQVSLGSMYDTYQIEGTSTLNNITKYTYNKTYKSNNIRLFGHADFGDDDIFTYGEDSFSFEEEYYTFTSTYHLDHVNQINEGGSDSLGTELLAGIHAQKSIYGNGYTVNMSNLCFSNCGKYDTDGGTSARLIPTDNDYFQGPLPYIVVGTSSLPMVRAYAQDNIGLYLDGDDIVVNDLKIKNVDTQDNMYNYNYAGTVVEVNGENCTIENCIVSDGKNVVRAFSADGLLIDNCILRNGGEFLLQIGSNRENKIDFTQQVSISSSRGTFEGTLGEYFSGELDTELDVSLLWYMLTGSLSESDSISIMNQVLEYCTNTEGMYNGDGSLNYDAEIRVRDTYFYNSGIFSIAFECAFNGPYMVNGSPISTTKSSTWSSLMQSLGTALFGQYPSDIGGTSYPVHLTLEGDTKFYDFKTVDSIDMTGLIYENISSLMTSFGVSGLEDFSLDDIFRIKELAHSISSANGTLYTNEDGSYLNTAVIWYGGGVNLSTLTDNTTTGYSYSEEIELDMTPTYWWENDYSLEFGGVDLLAVMNRAVLAVTGSNPFKYVSNGQVVSGQVPELFGEVPQFSDLLD